MEELEKLQTLKRSLRRKLHRVQGTPRRPRRKKTGQPDWFARMQWQVNQKKILRRLPVSELVVHMICTPKQAACLRRVGIETVWDLVDTTYERLLLVPGFGPKTLAKLWQDAKIKGNLDMKWKPL